MPQEVKNYRLRLRLEVLKHYGGGKLACVCCGWQSAGYKLQLDHINGGGTAHRKELGRGSLGAGAKRLLIQLRRDGYPPGYRTLCAGCNAMMEPGAERCLLHAG